MSESTTVPPAVAATQPVTDLRSYILQCPDVKYEPVTVPEWNNAVVVIRSLTAEEKDKFEESITYTVRERRGRKVREKAKVDQKKLRAKLVIACACKAVNDPTPLFSKADVDALGVKNGAAMDRLFEVCQRLSGFTEDDIETMGNE